MINVRSLGEDDTNYEDRIEEETAENTEPEVQTDQTFEERLKSSMVT